MKTKDTQIENLKWVRIFDPVHIPKEYINQIKEKEFTTEKFYEFQSRVCLLNTETGLTINPYNLLFVLVDDSNRVKGILWMVIDILANSLVINTFSVDKEYWGNGKAVSFLIEKAAEIKEKEKLDRVYWITRSPKHSEKFGFKRSKHTLMEYSHGQFGKRHIDGGRCEAGRNSGPNDEGTAETNEGNAGENGPAVSECANGVV